ncbi:hypothetical protein MAHJHV50_50960 [Mycobacterium avium subsp. hominissuis]
MRAAAAARIVAGPKLALMRIALAQILSGTDPAARRVYSPTSARFAAAARGGVGRSR